ncbi:MAG: glutamate racemase [Oscillospiraceae bacterium]|jgi:glutamate racemase|nr:glutamate racemase [Oscillospiraceae bacterium]
MDSRPIGVFDSGLGGLSAMKELTALLPNEDIIYFGDSARVPYGGRSEETLIKYAKQDIRFLQSFDIKAILIACGTVSSIFHLIREDILLPCVGVVESSAEDAAGKTKNNRIGIIATSATISSGAFERTLLERYPEAEIMSVSCPLFVPLVENGRFEPGDTVIETVAEEYLSAFRDFGCDTLILGCTHYPLLKRVISGVLPGVRLIDPGAASSGALMRLLREKALLSDRKSGGQVSYHVSDNPGNFSRLGSIFMGREIDAGFQKVDIEKW